MKKLLLKILTSIFALTLFSAVMSGRVSAAAPEYISQPNTFCVSVLGGQWRTGPNYADNGECFTGDRCQIREQNGVPRATNCDISSYAELLNQKTATVIAFLNASEGLPDDVLSRLARYEPRDTTGRDISNLSGECKSTVFFGFPTWYKYLPKKSISPCELEIRRPSDVLLILLAVIEILTRLGAFLAVGYIIWGGIKFTLSQGEPEGIANARNTIINAVIGLVLTVMATALISFIGQRITG